LQRAGERGKSRPARRHSSQRVVHDSNLKASMRSARQKPDQG
jgi:hypothetical protein